MPCHTTLVVAARVGAVRCPPRCPPRSTSSALVVTPRLMPQSCWTRARLLACTALAVAMAALCTASSMMRGRATTDVVGDVCCFPALPNPGLPPQAVCSHCAQVAVAHRHLTPPDEVRHLLVLGGSGRIAAGPTRDGRLQPRAMPCSGMVAHGCNGCVVLVILHRLMPQSLCRTRTAFTVPVDVGGAK